jgi:hypothetical protein
MLWFRIDSHYSEPKGTKMPGGRTLRVDAPVLQIAFEGTPSMRVYAPTDVTREIQENAALIGSGVEQHLLWLVKFATQSLPADGTPQWGRLVREIKGFIPHASWPDAVGIGPEFATVRRLKREIHEALEWLSGPDGGYWWAKSSLTPRLSRVSDYGPVSISAYASLPGRFLAAAVNTFIQAGQRLRRCPNFACAKPFVSIKGRRHCSTRCGNIVRVNRHRQSLREDSKKRKERDYRKKLSRAGVLPKRRGALPGRLK